MQKIKAARSVRQWLVAVGVVGVLVTVVPVKETKLWKENSKPPTPQEVVVERPVVRPSIPYPDPELREGPPNERSLRPGVSQHAAAYTDMTVSRHEPPWWEGSGSLSDFVWTSPHSVPFDQPHVVTPTVVLMLFATVALISVSISLQCQSTWSERWNKLRRRA